MSHTQWTVDAHAEITGEVVTVQRLSVLALALVFGRSLITAACGSAELTGTTKTSEETELVGLSAVKVGESR
jgi:hypothetical protein